MPGGAALGADAGGEDALGVAEAGGGGGGEWMNVALPLAAVFLVLGLICACTCPFGCKTLDA